MLLVNPRVNNFNRWWCHLWRTLFKCKIPIVTRISMLKHQTLVNFWIRMLVLLTTWIQLIQMWTYRICLRQLLLDGPKGKTKTTHLDLILICLSLAMETWLSLRTTPIKIKTKVKATCKWVESLISKSRSPVATTQTVSSKRVSQAL